ncbi:MAG: deoxyribose-phosphate aldolase [candidate division KSB1 bacterium]|nr:deoxyribose-phosphate aldolase [candidate division KSB1 bacterium]
MIDHSLLHPAMTDDAIRAGCELARRYAVATVCVKPYAIELAQANLQGADVGICAVVAFPHGNSSTALKILEAEDAILRGAIEIDMVVNIGKVLSYDWAYVSREIEAVNNVVVKRGALLKVIFENDYLGEKHIIKLCELCGQHRVAFVKTSTGYGFVKQADGRYAYRGATDDHLRLMRANSPPWVAIKAAGGIRTLDDVLRVRRIGVTRIGATATEEILEEARRRGIV